jgi:predicted DNA-binding transcriptional regulator AlpA
MNHKGQALKKAIEQTKTTKSDLIKRLGISVPTFYSWLNNKNLSDDKISKVTKALSGGAVSKAPKAKKKAGKTVKAAVAKGTSAGHKGHALKSAIEQTKTKKSDLIRRLGISVPTFYSWLNKKDLSEDKVSRVKNALSGTKSKAAPAAKSPAKASAAPAAGGNHVVTQINDLQRIIINLQQHLIDSLRGGSKSAAPAKKTRKRRKKAAK